MLYMVLLQLQQYLPFTVLKLNWPFFVSMNLTLQQYLPFTVLKLSIRANEFYKLQQYLPFTVLKLIIGFTFQNRIVATVPTVYGIETLLARSSTLKKTLQQYLPFTVLKPIRWCSIRWRSSFWVATVPTVYGIETF